MTRTGLGLAGAVLTSPAGEPIVPSSLAWSCVEVSPAQLEAGRCAARRRGRVIERDGLALFGLGLAARLVLPRGLAALGAASQASDLLDRLGEAGPGGQQGLLPVALGALPFDRLAPSSLAIPAVTLVTGDRCPSGVAGLALAVAPRGALEATLVRHLGGAPHGGPGEGSDGHGRAEEGDGELPDRFELVSATSHRAFLDLVGDALGAIGRGAFEKVVLAREVQVRANRPFGQEDLLGRLRALHPSCTAFALEGFLGASPELLLRREARTVTSVPLAGTVARSGDPEEDRRLADALLASPKDLAEHRLVVRAIVSSLEPVCSSVTWSETPAVLELRNVAHLATSVTAAVGIDEATGRAPGALELAADLHPTPAVGGSPRPEALAYLASREQLDRGRYAGPVGYVDAAGDGEWWVGIRSAIVEGPTARLLAGVGIVAGSDPKAELAETQLKLQALLAVAVRP